MIESGAEYDIVIVGGGAAGLMAAVIASGEKCRVAVFEKNSRCGRKLLLTGKGRCNITNTRQWRDFKEHIHPDSGFFRPSFMAFSNEDTVSMFNKLGLSTVEERGQRVFPASGKSSDVRDAMESYVTASSNVEIFCDMEVLSVKRVDGCGFIINALSLSNRMDVSCVKARAVIIATGGLSYPATGSTGDGYRFAESMGHSIVRTRPSLTALMPQGYNFALSGLTLRNVALSLIVDGGVVREEFGELTFTNDGLEGALGFRVSRKAVAALDSGKRVAVRIDLKPAVSEAELKSRIEREYRKGLRLARFVGNFLPVQAVAPFMDANPSLNVSNLPVKLKNWEMPLKGYKDYSRAVVTSGGVSLDEISRKTMESKLMPGLYFAGEVMDLDADTGGYNLQIAFSTAASAVRAAVANVSER
ncbi:MAG TPA: aminoacetone oxidase family FAD-binding enzyme [Candidatus Coprenecus stercoravium]|uniref:Aminoacetone oxidase family FAD-binding enzyme n=1 Tax=Candidatus Coprenecus stercoravium TaxID=2840735 RepID=A0A9D2GQR8_9BACT|nr:aminoacetone oxidase family FAD-binding enzyme [Candidatus Coprenecus stercoravium]